MERSCEVRLSEKQLTRIPLFRSVRNINGQKVFKRLVDVCRIVKYKQGAEDPDLSSKNHFIYVKEGEILVFKVVNSNRQQKSLIKAYKSQEYCGFQDYPLFWNEKVEVEVSASSTLCLIPIPYFYQLFRRVIPMTYLQSKAEYMKRLPLFRGIQLQKIFKLACLSQKLRVQRGQVFKREGETIENVFIIFSGKIQLDSSMLEEPLICGQNEDFLVKEIKQGINYCLFTARCLHEADLISIPKQEFIKIIDVRYKLEQPEHKDLAKDEQYPEQSPQITQNLLELEEAKEQKIRSKTLYARSFVKKSEKVPSEQVSRKSLTKSNFYSTKDKQKQKLDIGQNSRAYSLGDIQLLKFMERKQKAERRNFFKYIESRAPDIVLNPSKQFAVVRPVYKSNSLYVKNLKRKIKYSTHYKKNKPPEHNQTIF